MSAFIITADGISGMAMGKPFAAVKTHPNYDAIIRAVKDKLWDTVHDLVNISRAIEKQVIRTSKMDVRVKVCPEAGVILFDGLEIRNSLVDRIIKMLADGFDVTPMTEFLTNCMELNKQVADRIFDWIEAGCMPITEDGCFLAYKRVNFDYTSFYDGKTMNPVGGHVILPRAMCDDNQHNTCSAGLHFCSQGYLPSYHGGGGRILVLKVNPRDVVAIPVEYGTAKGRACRYEVISELEEAPRARAEFPETSAMPQPVVETKNIAEAAKATTSFMYGYVSGFAAGKNKATETKGGWLFNGEYNRGYDEGYKDGRGHKPMRFKKGNLPPNPIRHPAI